MSKHGNTMFKYNGNMGPSREGFLEGSDVNQMLVGMGFAERGWGKTRVKMASWEHNRRTNIYKAYIKGQTL